MDASMPGLFERALATVEFVARVVEREETGSTNDDALALARDGAPEGTVVVAGRQREGRGRKGRAWMAAPGTAVLASWIVRPAYPPEFWTLLPLAAGVAAAEGVESVTGLEVRLKWPNDLLVRVRAEERKLGGILVEAEPPRFAVIGLGLNVSTRTFPEEIAGSATSVVASGGRDPGRPAVLAAVLERFAEAAADPAGALGRYRARCATLGRAVRVERRDGALEGVALDVDARGALVVRAAGGDQVVPAGDVVHLRPLSPSDPR